MTTPPPWDNELIPYSREMLTELAVAHRREQTIEPLTISMYNEDCSSLDLSMVELEQSILTGVSFAHANLSGSHLVVCNLSRCNLTDANFCLATVNETILTNCTADKANFSSCDLYGTRFDHCSLQGATCASAQMSRTTFWGRNTDIRAVTFDSATMVESSLVGVNLTGSTFSLTNLMGANLLEANLSRCYFYLSDLSDADLTRANLTGATFHNVLLAGTKFTSVEQLLAADLSQQRQSVVKCCEEEPQMMLDLSESILHNHWVSNWLALHIQEGAEPHWQTLARWAANHDQQVKLEDNPPMVLLRTWILDGIMNK